MRLGGNSGIGGDFHLPDWIQNLTGSGGAAHAPGAGEGKPSILTVPMPAARPQSPAEAAKAAAKTTCQEVWGAIGKVIDKVHGTDSRDQIGWLKRAGQVPARDVTDRFKQLNAAAVAGQNTLPPDAKDYVYLNVGGIFTERYPGYLKDNIGREKKLGLDAREVPIDTDATVAVNAKVVRDAILEASKNGKQVVMIGHSKGGVDIMAAIALYPELKPHVRAVVALQAPYAGSPIASDFQTCPQTKPLMDTMIKRGFCGDPKSLADLSYDARKKFIAAHPYPKGIPTVSLATDAPKGPKSIVAPVRDYVLGRYGVKGDGVVARDDAEIPGSSVVRLEGMDHAGGAMKGPDCADCAYSPGDVTQAMITIALTTPPG